MNLVDMAVVFERALEGGKHEQALRVGWQMLHVLVERLPKIEEEKDHATHHA